MTDMNNLPDAPLARAPSSHAMSSEEARAREVLPDSDIEMDD